MDPHEELAVREAAAWALSQLGTASARAVLNQHRGAAASSPTV